MKNLSGFNVFLIEKFLEKKKLVVTSIRDWREYADGKPVGTPLGSKVEVVITADATDYPPNKDGTKPVAPNLYEKFVIKVPTTVSVSVGDEVALVNPTAKVYGDYGDKLSVTADDVVPAAAAGEKARS